MKLENRNGTNAVQIREIDKFWNWFRDVSRSLSTEISRSDLLKQLDGRVRELDPKLSWEIGPGTAKAWQLVISPNLDRDRLELARQVVAHAPVLPDWEFHSTRQSKEWGYKFQLETIGGGKVLLDASDWTFVLLRYPDGAHEILLGGPNIPDLTADERWQAAAITLESILGEEIILDRVDDFELVRQLDPRFASEERPIQGLREAIAEP